MLHEVAADVSKFLIGWQLPREMQDRIGQLLRTELIRRDCAIHYTITHTEKPGRVKVKTSFSFDVINLTNHTVKYQQYVAFEKHDRPQIQKLECYSDDQSATYKLDGNEISREKKDEPGVIEAYGSRIEIRPNRVEGGIRYRVAAAYSMEFPEDYSDIFSFAGATVNTTITAEYPSDIEFVAPPADVNTMDRWEYHRLFLPAEHIHVRWLKKGTDH
jgi:hypothetical protein